MKVFDTSQATLPKADGTPIYTPTLLNAFRNAGISVEDHTITLEDNSTVVMSNNSIHMHTRITNPNNSLVAAATSIVEKYKPDEHLAIA